MPVISSYDKSKVDASVSELAMVVFNEYHHDHIENNAQKYS